MYDARNGKMALSKARQPFKSIQAGRGVAALAVLLYHVQITFAEPKYFHTSHALPFAWGHAGVEYFFVLSGFVMTYTVTQKWPISPIQFLKKRFRRILPPLWAAIGVAWVGKMVVSHVDLQSLTLVQAVSALLAFPIDSGEPFLAVEWTLRAEVLFYILFSTLFLNRRLGVAVLSVWFTLCSLCALGLVPNLQYWSYYNLLFFFGIFIALATRFTTSLPVFACLTGGMIYCVTAACEVVGINVGDRVLTLGYGLASGAVLYGLIAWENNYDVWIPRWILALGDASYSVYLIHFIAVSFFTKLMCRIVPDPNPVTFYLLFALVAMCSLFVGVLFYKCVEQPMLKKPYYDQVKSVRTTT